MSIYTITPWPLLAFVTYHFPNKTSQFPEIIWNQSYYMAPIFQHLPSARSKIFFLTLFFSDLIPETWEQSLLKLCCWLVTACFRSFCHTVLNIRSPVTHSSFFATNRAFTCVKSDTYSESHLAKDLRARQMSIILCWENELGGILTTALFISRCILLFDQERVMELLESNGDPYNSHENWHTST